MEAISAALVLISGYVFLSTCTLTVYRTKRLDGQRLYINSIGYGILFMVAPSAYLFINHINEASPVFEAHKNLNEALGNKIDFHAFLIFIASVLSVALSAFFSVVSNLVLHLSSKVNSAKTNFQWLPNYAKLAASCTDDKFEELILRAFSNHQPFMVLTTIGKVYVGFSSSPFEPTRTKSSEIEIIPIYLGFLSDQDKDISLTINYQKLDQFEDFVKSPNAKIVIRKDHIISISLFDKEISSALTNLKLGKLVQIHDIQSMASSIRQSRERGQFR